MVFSVHFISQKSDIPFFQDTIQFILNNWLKKSASNRADEIPAAKFPKNYLFSPLYPYLSSRCLIRNSFQFISSLKTKAFRIN